LNQLITAAREGRWVEVNPTITAIKALAKPAPGDSAGAAKLRQVGDEALSAGKFSDAITSFEKARAVDPSSVEARIGVATSQVRAGLFEPAAASLVDALLAAPESGAAWLLAAENFAELDKPEAAAASLKLAFYLAKDRTKALAFLQGAPSSIKSAKFKAVIAAALPTLDGLPAR
jgi:Tfp pilus assembly protein PilF